MFLGSTFLEYVQRVHYANEAFLYYGASSPAMLRSDVHFKVFQREVKRKKTDLPIDSATYPILYVYVIRLC